VNLFTEKKEVGKPDDFDHMADDEVAVFACPDDLASYLS